MTLSFEQRGAELVAFFVGKPEFGEFITDSQEVVASPSTPFQGPQEVRAVNLSKGLEALPAEVGTSSRNGGENLKKIPNPPEKAVKWAIILGGTAAAVVVIGLILRAVGKAKKFW